MSETDAVQIGMAEKAKEFQAAGGEVYQVV